MLCLAASILFTLCSTGAAFLENNTPPVFDMKREWIIPEDEPVVSGGRGSLRSRPRDRRVAGSKPDSTEDLPCMGSVAR
ncbi:hypothetical protein AVEN_102034-1 [Araneus ventricosus]|uniref:Uncharacterized protein n=1 Tax=Araneus ventricosus TaxID=182803 RepID=A0A4Y2NDG0_ARAVE|nr:hypothetical protein AVEN_102034-1 [Araneus ventricosus]